MSPLFHYWPHPEPVEGLKVENEELLGDCRLPAHNVSLIWLKIIKQLDPKDKKTLSRAFPECHDLVEKKRTTLLFSEVVPAFIENWPEDTLLKCRQLTKSWTEGLDREYRQHPVRFLLGFEISTKEKRNALLVNSFYSADAIQEFLEEMREHTGNPFPGGHVEFECMVPAEAVVPNGIRIEFWENALQLCQRFGEHVSSVKFKYGYRFEIGYFFDFNFRNCLVHLPNLKRLSIWGGEMCNFVSRLVRLPRLQNLEMIDTIQTSRALREVVLNSCPVPGNMKRLSLSPMPGDEFTFPEVAFRFVNLEVLQTHLVIQDLRRLSSLASVPPLKETEIVWRDEKVQSQELFRMLEPFSNSLINVVTSMSVRDHGEWSRTRINLPNLRGLCLRDFHASLDPFVQLTSLADLIIYFYEPEFFSAGTNRVDFLWFEDRMHESNIWSLIPFLKKLTVGTPIEHGRVKLRDFYRRIKKQE